MMLAPGIADRAHIRGIPGAPMRLLIYGDYECPYTRKALINVAQIRGQLGDALVYAFRNFPLIEIHPHAFHAALAAEAAPLQRKFWEMHDLLFRRESALTDHDLVTHAASIGLDGTGFAPISPTGRAYPALTRMSKAESEAVSKELRASSSTESLRRTKAHPGA